MDDTKTVILRLTAACGPDKSICPSDVARALDVDWQPRLKQVRAAAVELARAGRIDILRKGKPVSDLDSLRGVIRLRSKSVLF
jgi:hypothetical protein